MRTELWRASDMLRSTANLRQYSAQLARSPHLCFNDYAQLHNWSVEHSADFWLSIWTEFEVVGDLGAPPHHVQADVFRNARFFPNATLNYAENLLTATPRDGDAVVYRDEQGRRAKLSWSELRLQTARLARHFQDLGIAPGDRIAAILPNVPEAIVSVLAASAVGATWSSCSPDFGRRAILDRFGQIAPRVLVAATGYTYAGSYHALVAKLSATLRELPTVEHVVIVDVPGAAGHPTTDPKTESAIGAVETLAATVRDGAPLTVVDFAQVISSAKDIGAEPVFARLPFDHPLFILFSSGTTGQPKCIVHRAGGILLKHLTEHRLHADVRPGDRLFYFTTLGWMMWNWLLTGLASGATLMLYDGNPFHPHPDVLWDYAAEERITHFGTSAKYIDAMKKAQLAPARTHDLTALRSVMSTGSPLAPESFDYVYADIKSDLHLASISGGTDICGCFVIGNPLLPVNRGEIQCAALGMDVDVVDENGRSITGQKGELVCRTPFPSMPLGFWNDTGDARYQAAYFSRFENIWHHGDFAERRANGSFVIHGRSDATLNPGGVRIGTAEIYRQVEQLPEILESIAVGQDWQGDVRIVLFVVLKPGHALDATLADRIRRQIRTGASPRHVPARIVEVRDIPRTKSGKISELAVRDIVHGRPVVNTDALANTEALDQFANREELKS